MAKVKLCGVRNLDFKTKEGDTIKGIKIFFSYPDPGVVGEITDNKFISTSLCSDLGVTFEDLKTYVGDFINLDVNIKGKLTAISPAEG